MTGRSVQDHTPETDPLPPAQSPESTPSHALTHVGAPVTELKPDRVSVHAKDGVITSGSTTKHNNPLLMGSGLEPGHTVTLFDNQIKIAQVLVDARGFWAQELTAPLGNGIHLLTIRVKGRDGSQSHPSDPFVLTVDAPLIQPTIDGIYDGTGNERGWISEGASTDETQPTLMGSNLQALQLVKILDQGQLIAEVRANRLGQWKFQPDKPMNSGKHVFTVQTISEDGRPGPISYPFEMTIEPQPNLKPVIDHLLDSVGSEQGALDSGSFTDDRQPTLMGSNLQVNQRVTIYDNDQPIGIARTDSEGNWQFQPSADLAYGEHRFTIRVTYPDGNQSPMSDSFVVTIEATTTHKPAIDGAYDNAGSEHSLIDNGGTTDDSTPTLSGTGLAPHQRLTLYDNGLKVGEARSNALGYWVFEPQAPWAKGVHRITIETINRDGGKNPHSDPYVITINPPDSKPVIDGLYDKTGAERGWITNGGVTDDYNPIMTGKVDPATTDSVEILENGRRLGFAKIDELGHWRFQTNLSQGLHQLAVVANSYDGNISPLSNPFVLTVEPNTTATPTIKPQPGFKPFISEVHDRTGIEQGLIQDRGRTDDGTPILSGSGLNAQMSWVQIYDNGRHIGSTDIGPTGTWLFKPTSSLAVGKHQIHIEVLYRNGGKSLRSDVFTLTVEQPRPAIDGVYDQDLQPNLIANGAITSDSEPMIGGGGLKPNQLLKIYDNGKVIGEVQADPLGNWLYEPFTRMSNGTHAFTVEPVDRNGNAQGKPSDPYVINITSQVSAAPGLDHSTLHLSTESVSNKEAPPKSDESSDLPSPRQDAGTLDAQTSSNAVAFLHLSDLLSAQDMNLLQASEPLIGPSLASITLEDLGDWGAAHTLSTGGIASEVISYEGGRLSLGESDLA